MHFGRFQVFTVATDLETGSNPIVESSREPICFA